MLAPDQWDSVLGSVTGTIYRGTENLGHADTRMVERHYGYLAPTHKRDAIGAGAARFGLVATSNVRPLR